MLSPHTSQNNHHQKIYKQQMVESVEKRESSCTIGGNVNWYSPYGEHYGNSLKKLGKNYRQSHYWPYTLFSSVHFSRSVVSDSLWPHETQHARPPCLSPTPRGHSNSCPSSQWCHPTMSSSAVPSSPAPSPSQHKSLFQWVNSSHEVAKVLEFQL